MRTRQVVLMPLQLHHRGHFVATLNSPSVMQYAGGSWPQKRAESAFAFAIKQWSMDTPKQRIWAIARDQDLAGLVSAQRHCDANAICELGVLIHTRYHGRGVAREALGRLMGRWSCFAKNDPYPKVWLARVKPGNHPAKRLFGSLGFEVKGLNWAPATGPSTLMYASRRTQRASNL